MITALYIVSPNDNVGAFASSARNVECCGKTVYVGEVSHDIRSVALVDEPPMELKRKLQAGGAWDDEWRGVKSRVVALLSALRLGQDDLRIFIHFGGQGADEVKWFNRSLARLLADDGMCSCYAISFGNKLPNDLFPSGKFSPPTGTKFFTMCRELQSGTIEDFSFLRALRMLLSCATPDEKGMYDAGATCRQLLSRIGQNTIGDALSTGEKEFIMVNPFLYKVFNGSHSGNVVSIPNSIGEQELKLFLRTLEMKEAKQ